MHLFLIYQIFWAFARAVKLSFRYVLSCFVQMFILQIPGYK
ncbi:hypothetical protein ELI_2085 [Eubacterium callanderi]|uniref:Uncharacterized protein n=1 Tax=Eubacterium callanderi TaxID=53442 RepID=E3GMK5_9FIRM|nr:hypothetical protein ELI_2085 [Eubacterium callanderi]